jgi:hypothetical protein
MGLRNLADGEGNEKVGDRYPSARVRGIDLSPIQPVWVPANVDFLVDDCEEEWLDRNVDLVHLRFTIIMIKDEANLLRNAFKCVISLCSPPYSFSPLQNLTL